MNNKPVPFRLRAPLAFIFLPPFVGCARVDPAPAIRRAADMAAERAEVTEIYAPADREAAGRRVEQLLADGLSVDEAVQIALLNSPPLQAMFATIGVSQADLVQSTLPSNPTMSLVPKFPEGGGRAELNLSLAQELVDLWQIPMRKQVAQAELDRTVLQVAQAAVDLAADVRAAAYRLIMLHQLESVLDENVTLVKRSADLARRRFEAGAAGRTDYNLAQMHVADVQLQSLAVARERRLAQTELARLTGLTGYWPLPDLGGELPEPTPLPSESLLSAAVQRRFDVQVASVAVESARYAARLEACQVLPSLTAGFDMERTDRRALPGRNVLADTARDSIRSGGLTAPDIQTRGERQAARREIIDLLIGPAFGWTLPLWDQNQAQIARARYVLEQRERQYEALVVDVQGQVLAATAVLENADEAVRFFREEALPQARDNLADAVKLYEGGQENIAVLVLAQETLVTREREYVRTLGDYAAARVSLARALGGFDMPASVGAHPAASAPTADGGE